MKIVIPPRICNIIDRMIEECITTEHQRINAYDDGLIDYGNISADDGFDDVTEELRKRIIDLLNSEQKINNNIIEVRNRIRNSNTNKKRKNWCG